MFEFDQDIEWWILILKRVTATSLKSLIWNYHFGFFYKAKPVDIPQDVNVMMGENECAKIKFAVRNAIWWYYRHVSVMKSERKWVDENQLLIQPSNIWMTFSSLAIDLSSHNCSYKTDIFDEKWKKKARLRCYEEN